MASLKKTIFITGCSDGGLGSALALAFHEAGWRVFASARNLNKLNETEAVGIESIHLDVLSEESIQAAVSNISELTGGGLDVLLNNAGVGYNMPFLDLQTQKVRDQFELNVFSLITMIQAFAPLLIKTRGIIINNTSIAGAFGLPIQSAYNASKAAASMFTACLRLEMQPLGIKVIDLKTGGIKSNFMANLMRNAGTEKLPPNSYYNIAKEAIEKFISGDWAEDHGSDRHVWARQIVRDVSKRRPPYQVWRGASAALVWFATFLPPSWLDSEAKKRTGLDVMGKKIKEQGGFVVPKSA